MRLHAGFSAPVCFCPTNNLVAANCLPHLFRQTQLEQLALDKEALQKRNVELEARAGEAHQQAEALRQENLHTQQQVEALRVQLDQVLNEVVFGLVVASPPTTHTPNPPQPHLLRHPLSIVYCSLLFWFLVCLFNCL